MQAPRTPGVDPAPPRTILRRLGRVDMIWPALIVLVIVASLVSDNFLTVNNLLNILRHATIVGLLAVGVTVVLIGGNFDLSVGAIVTMAAVLSIEIGPVDGPLTALAIVLPLVMATVIGSVNGAIVGGLRANSIVVTVGMQFLIIGLVLALVSGQHVRVDGATAFYVGIANGYLLGIPVPVYLLLIAVVAAQFILREAPFGRHVHAVGGNENVARLAGIRTRETIVATYMISGFLAGVTGVLVGSRVRNLDPHRGSRLRVRRPDRRGAGRRETDRRRRQRSEHPSGRPRPGRPDQPDDPVEHRFQHPAPDSGRRASHRGARQHLRPGAS